MGFVWWIRLTFPGDLFRIVGRGPAFSWRFRMSLLLDTLSPEEDLRLSAHILVAHLRGVPGGVCMFVGVLTIQCVYLISTPCFYRVSCLPLMCLVCSSWVSAGVGRGGTHGLQAPHLRCVTFGVCKPWPLPGPLGVTLTSFPRDFSFLHSTGHSPYLSCIISHLPPKFNLYLLCILISFTCGPIFLF